MHFKISNIPYHKWLLVFKVLAFDIIVVAVVLTIMYLSGNLGSTNYRSAYSAFFYPLNQFDYFFRSTAWQTALREEAYYRGPIWILSASGFTLSIKGRKLDNLLVWSTILIPTAFWAYSHEAFNLPIFIVGISWGWLVARTKSLWPAIVSHMTANVLIYFALKILLLFIKI